MRGGIVRFHGAAKAARHYLDQDSHIGAEAAYYLEGNKRLATLLDVSRDGSITNRAAMDGDQYENWAGGFDPFTGAAKGVIRTDENAARFDDMTVNGPKSWSLAAALHPDLSAAYDAAQTAAAEAIASTLAQHMLTRVGPRGAQERVHVDGISVATVRHETSRAGDPHRHIHEQVSNKVWARGKWRATDWTSTKRMTAMVNAVGHRVMMSHPEFRAAAARHGLTFRVDGEIEQLVSAVPAMSKRAMQVMDNVVGYEAEWRSAHPGGEPSAALVRDWVQTGWGDERDGKHLHPTSGAVIEAGWLAEMREHVDVDALLALGPVPVGGVTPSAVTPAAVAARAADRVWAARRAVQVLGASRSTWNLYELIAASNDALVESGVVGDPVEVQALADDVAVLAQALCESVLPDGKRPDGDYQRHLSSPAVRELERDLKGRLAVRGLDVGTSATMARIAPVVAARGLALDHHQIAAVRTIAGSARLVVIEGPAGAGKTSVLAAAGEGIRRTGHRMLVVVPSRKAATVAAREVGGDADTAHALAYRYGYRWDEQNVWMRLSVGDRDPVTRNVYTGPVRRRDGYGLGSGDTLVVDEAGMLEQHLAAALATIADERNADLVLVGDRRQLAAIGRGGVMSMAAAAVEHVHELKTVHRFRDRDQSIDTEYAALSLEIRAGLDPGGLFDKLVESGHLALHETEEAMIAALADESVARQEAGESQLLMAATNREVTALNKAVRDRMVTAGLVDDRETVAGVDLLPIGVGDVVQTLRNDDEVGVQNRDVWRVTAIRPDGGLALAAAVGHGRAGVTAEYVREHVSLAYAATVHAAQGDTVDHAAPVISKYMDAQGMYPAMTRGRYSDVGHIVGTVDEAREVFVDVTERNRADDGLDKAKAAVVMELEPHGQAVTQAVHAERNAADAARQVQRAREADLALVAHADALCGAFDRANAAHRQLVAARDALPRRQRPAADARIAEAEPALQVMARAAIEAERAAAQAKIRVRGAAPAETDDGRADRLARAAAADGGDRVVQNARDRVRRAEWASTPEGQAETARVREQQTAVQEVYVQPAAVRQRGPSL